MPPLRLTLVRHGETEWTERGLLHGRLDVPLSAVGKRHSEMAANRLRGEKFNAIYSSPLGRAMQTASILGEAVGLTPIPLDGLRERDFGWSEGKPMKLVDPSGTGAWWFRPLLQLMTTLTAEPPQHFAARVKSAVDMIQMQHTDGRVILVTHWNVLSFITALLVDGDPLRWRERGPWAAGSISELQAGNGLWHAVQLNDHTHIQQQEARST